MARAKKTVAKRAAAREAAGRSGDRTVASNRRARHDYDILETFECGIVLQGSEVKSLREGKAQLSDAYARVVRRRAVAVRGPHPALAVRHRFRRPRPRPAAQAARPPQGDRRADGPDPAAGAHPGARSRSTSGTARPRSSWPWPGAASSTTSARPSLSREAEREAVPGRPRRRTLASGGAEPPARAPARRPARGTVRPEPVAWRGRPVGSAGRSTHQGGEWFRLWSSMWEKRAVVSGATLKSRNQKQTPSLSSRSLPKQ